MNYSNGYFISFAIYTNFLGAIYYMTVGAKHMELEKKKEYLSARLKTDSPILWMFVLYKIVLKHRHINIQKIIFLTISFSLS